MDRKISGRVAGIEFWRLLCIASGMHTYFWFFFSVDSEGCEEGFAEWVCSVRRGSEK